MTGTGHPNMGAEAGAQAGGSMTYNVSSLDGGGIRGVIRVILLDRFSAEPGFAKWLDRVQFLAGTSTGSLIALGIGAGLASSDIRRLDEQDGSRIFIDSLLDDVKELGKLIGADHDTEPREQLLPTLAGLRPGEDFGWTTWTRSPTWSPSQRRSTSRKKFG